MFFVCVFSNMASKAIRREALGSFTAEVVYDCLQRGAGDLSADIARARSDANMELFMVDYTKGQENESIVKYRSLFQRVLLANSSAIFSKSRMIVGRKLWNGMLVKIRAPKFLAHQMYALVALTNHVKAIKKSTTSGVRLPSYLAELLISLIDVAPDAGSGAAVDDCDDEDEEADGTQAQIKAQSGEQKEQNIHGFFELQREPMAKKANVRRPGSRLLQILLSEPDLADERVPPKPPAETGASSSCDHSLFWFAEAAQTACRQLQGHQEHHLSSKADEDTGMTLFIFSDGAEWLSEVPWLSLVEDENTSKEPAQVVCEVTKKPVTERKIPMRRPAAALKTTAWHREHTRVYFLAKKEYEAEVLSGKRKKNEEQRRKFLSQRTAEAKAQCPLTGVHFMDTWASPSCRKNKLQCASMTALSPWPCTPQMLAKTKKTPLHAHGVAFAVASVVAQPTSPPLRRFSPSMLAQLERPCSLRCEVVCIGRLGCS